MKKLLMYACALLIGFTSVDTAVVNASPFGQKKTVVSRNKKKKTAKRTAKENKKEKKKTIEKSRQKKQDTREKQVKKPKKKIIYPF